MHGLTGGTSSGLPVSRTLRPSLQTQRSSCRPGVASEIGVQLMSMTGAGARTAWARPAILSMAGPLLSTTARRSCTVATRERQHRSSSVAAQRASSWLTLGGLRTTGALGRTRTQALSITIAICRKAESHRRAMARRSATTSGIAILLRQLSCQCRLQNHRRPQVVAMPYLLWSPMIGVFPSAPLVSVRPIRAPAIGQL